jgi:ribonuclease P protein subunit POP4
LTGLKPNNLTRHELIGLKVLVKNADNLDSKGISGKIVDESRNTFTIEKNGELKIIIKKDLDFFINVNNQKIMIVGKNLVGRPEDRVKNRRKKRW